MQTSNEDEDDKGVTAIDLRGLLEYLSSNVARVRKQIEEYKKSLSYTEVLKCEGAVLAYSTLTESIKRVLTNRGAVLCPFCDGRGLDGDCPPENHDHKKECIRCDGEGLLVEKAKKYLA